MPFYCFLQLFLSQGSRYPNKKIKNSDTETLGEFVYRDPPLFGYRDPSVSTFSRILHVFGQNFEDNKRSADLSIVLTDGDKQNFTFLFQVNSYLRRTLTNNSFGRFSWREESHVKKKLIFNRKLFIRLILFCYCSFIHSVVQVCSFKLGFAR